ncbi:MAG: hypothetical protein P4L74_03085 [Candidatus Doudnabacteria bacterium]|nr:hypothetical protein [Candidatus Doudnabacteria bacterium]
MRRQLFGAVKILLIIAMPFIAYVIYLAPAFAEHGGAACFSPIDSRRTGKHNDYVWLFQWINWRNTVLCGIEPPTQDSGTQDYHVGSEHHFAPKPIPPLGQWQASHVDVKTKLWTVRLKYYAIKLPNGYHARIGWRWDDVDNLYFLTVSIKKIPEDWDKKLADWDAGFRNSG